MKKISLLLTLALTLAVTSCTDYDDDFKALNASISDLNSAVAELKSQVAGFSSLQTGITSLQGSVTALQSAVNSLPGELNGLKASLATQAANIQALQTALNSMIANYATSDDLAAAQAAINALTSQLTATQEDVATILESNNVYSGDVVINSSATLEFAIGLGEKVRVINGTTTGTHALKIDYTSLTAAEVAAANIVAKKVAGVVGNVSLTSTAAKGSIDVSNLKSVAGAYSVTGTDAMDDALAIVTGAASFNYDGGYNQPNLASAASVVVTNYGTVAGTSAGTLTVNFRNLTTADFRTFGDGAKTAVFTVATNVVLYQGVVDVTANAASNVELWNSNNTTGLTVSATKAGSVITIAGRVDDGVGATPTGQALSVLGSPTSVVNANAVGSVGAVTITAKEVNMNAMSSADGAIGLTSTTSVSFPALVSVTGAVTASSATSFIAPKFVVANGLSIAAAKTVELASAASYTGGATESLKFTALAAQFTAAAHTTLKSVDVTGKAASTNSFTATAANTVLASATFGGEIDAVSITGVNNANDKLTSLSTTGKIDSFSLINATKITSVTLDHTHITGGPGSKLIVTGNASLTSLKSNSDFLVELNVSNNAALASMDFSSYKTVYTFITDGTIAGAYGPANAYNDGGKLKITIKNNNLSGTFTKAVAATATTAYVEASISQASLLTLKPLIAAHKALAAGGTKPTAVLDIDVKSVNATNPITSLAAAMLANEAISAVIDATNAINLVDEFLLIN